MNWKKSIEAALVSSGAAVFAALPALLADNYFSWTDGYSLLVTFGAVFFSYLKTHRVSVDVTPPNP